MVMESPLDKTWAIFYLTPLLKTLKATLVA